MAAADPALFVLLGAALALGYAAHLVFRAHRVSDVGVLLLAGLALGPGLQVIRPDALAPAMPFLSALALVIVLFEGGLELDWRRTKPFAGRALTLTFATWVFGALLVALVAWKIVGLALPLALLLGCAVAATGMLVVIPLLAQIGASDEARAILTVETSLGDMLGVLAVTTGAVIVVGGASPWVGAATLGARFVVGAAVGVLGGVAWARVLHRFAPQKHGYPVTLAALLLTYAFAERIGGSGFLAALAFGLFLGNAKALTSLGGIARLAPMPEALRGTQSEILFALRSVYFVFLGLSIPRGVLTPGFVLAGLALGLALLAARALGVYLTQPKEAPRPLLLAMMPRGLAAAATAALPAAMGVPGAEALPGYTLVIILAADLFTSAGFFFVLRRRASLPKPGVTSPSPGP